MVVNRATARIVASVLRPTCEPSTCAFASCNAAPSTVNVLEPLALELDPDAGAEYGTLRHVARLVRVPSDLDPADLDSATP